MTNDDELMQRITAQVSQFQEYLKKLEENLQELEMLKISVGEFSNLKKGDKIQAPLANGIFFEATLEDPKNLLINVGEGVVLKKSIKDSLKLLEKQEVEIIKAKEEIEKKIQEFYSV